MVPSPQGSLQSPPGHEELDIRSYIQEALHSLEIPRFFHSPLGTLLSCLICFHTSAARRLDVGASVMLYQGGKSSTEGLHLPSDCLAQRTVMLIRVSSTYQRDLVLTPATHASIF